MKIKNLENTKKPAKIPALDSVRRTMYDIQVSILTRSKDGLKKTHIMYKNNLSYSILLKYLDDLLRLGLLEYDEDNHIYKTTDLGHGFLYAYRQLRKLLKGEDGEPIVLDKNLWSMAISKLHGIKRRTIYDNCALILEKASEIASKYALIRSIKRCTEVINGYIEFLTKLNFIERCDTNKFKTTSRGLQYLDTYLYFLLFNYLE
jgi:predicted transcriptional regulator